MLCYGFQLSVTPVLGDFNSLFWAPCSLHAHSTHTCMQNTHIIKLKIIKEKIKWLYYGAGAMNQ